MLVSDIIDRCLLLFADETSSPPVYLPRSTLLTFFNMCNKVMTDELDCFVRSQLIQLEENQAVYDLPDDCRTVLWAYRNNKLLTPSSVRRIDEIDDEWRTRKGEPEYYFLDAQQRNKLRVYKIPDSGGDQFIFNQTHGVVVAIDPAYSLQFDGQTANFTAGETVTGGSSGAWGVLAHVVQDNSYSGTLYFSEVTGTFVDNENLVGSVTGRAVGNGTHSEPTNTDTYPFVPNTDGVVVSMVGGDDTYNFQDAGGSPTTDGVVVAMGDHDSGDNLLITFSYYLGEMVETDNLPQPYINGEEMYVSWVMAQMYIVEAVEQDWKKVEHYLGRFARRSGIELTKLWTPQRQYQQQSYVAGSQEPARVRLPDEYGPTEY